MDDLPLPSSFVQLARAIGAGAWPRFVLRWKVDAYGNPFDNDQQLTPKEHRELIALTDTIEGWNVCRLELAQQLADRRGISWQQVVEELGLAAPRLRLG